MAGMISAMSRVVVCGIAVCAVGANAQQTVVQLQPGAQPAERISVDEALGRALKTTSLTNDGKPFHTVLEIGKPGEEYSGRVEVWWQGPQVYRVQMTSPKFSQTKVVNGDAVNEKDDGDYYPRWLENFALSILDPIPMAGNFRGLNSGVMIGQGVVRTCLSRDDRPGGITDQMTWAEVCLTGAEPRLISVLATNMNITFKDWKKFDQKQIARTVTTDVEGYEAIEAHMKILEELKDADPAMFEVKEVTPPEQRISTVYVSTATEESLLEQAPKIEWPSVREGKTNGYMIVYARTDRTGQVRETAKHNSDQAGLEDFGIKAALQYKFKPFIRGGVRVQMEMPLVLHFTSRIEDPIPILTVEDMKKQMAGCSVGSLPSGSAPVTIRVSVNEKGELTGFGPVGNVPGASWIAATVPMRSCHFAPLMRDGKATYYRGDVQLTAK